MRAVLIAAAGFLTTVTVMRGDIMSRRHPALYLAAALVLLGSITQESAQTQQQPADHPVVTIHGSTYTPRSIFARNMGTPEDQTTQFPPHKIVGNIYYVGTRTLSS